MRSFSRHYEMQCNHLHPGEKDDAELSSVYIRAPTGHQVMFE